MGPVVQGLTDKLLHRGPDDGGHWVDPDQGVALGHRRLAIIDLSQEGHQPMVSRCGRYVLVFNGEIYNFQGLRQRLEATSWDGGWRGASDTEVLLEAIAFWGVEETLKQSIGMFAFALWDRQRRLLYLGRDRLGEKPLYYGWGKGAFFFGSELKALGAHPGWRGDISPGALALFVRFNYVPAPYSIYEGVFKLSPGAFACVSLEWLRDNGGGQPTPLPEKSYWSARTAALAGVGSPFAGTAKEATAALDSLLRDAVRQQMVADVPLGAFLSGGIDSSTIVALMQAQSSLPVRTFTIGVDREDYNEARHARAVAQHLGTQHTELYVTPEDALAVIPDLPELYDEPFADPSQVPTFLVSKLTRRHVTVSLSGDGGDELFGGYNRYFLATSIWKRCGWLPPKLRQCLASGLTSLPASFVDRGPGWLSAQAGKFGRAGRLSDKLNKLAAILPASSPEELYLNLSSNWGGDLPLVDPAQGRLSIFSEPGWGEGFSSFPEKMMYLDMLSYLPDDILVKVDRAAMSVSLETRVPLLDHRVCEFAWKIPLHMKIRNGQGKWLLRQVLYRYVPAELVERPKRGFDIPIDAWIRGPLREWAEALLDERRLRDGGLFEPAPIRRRWAEHLTGKSNWQASLWNVLMFQSWLEARP
ncbi:asparagine synthetase B [Desulfuromonas versatilis]|uniref:asparagine synthase (glutamine-hydrolyzing) n=1 Tax=Desulfuromonas versatilis TaxID=2802975 RepID=A0ABM8HUW9_9BACT|nr:asparagine synthetase B [Desulfuromonas versatilis]